MPFKKVDIGKIVNNRKETDKDFVLAYDIIKERESIVEEIKKIRLEKKMSQKELSQLSGLTQQRISSFENNQVDFSLTNFIKILHALNVNTSAFKDAIKNSLQKVG